MIGFIKAILSILNAKEVGSVMVMVLYSYASESGGGGG